MRLLRSCSIAVYMLLLVALSVTTNAADNNTGGIPERKPLVLDTVLVDQGEPKAMIIAPDTAQYQKLANKVRAAIYAATGANLNIRRDDEFAFISGEPKEPEPDANVILLGNQDSSGLITHFNFIPYCNVDSYYPGKGGYIIKTIHDPWGRGVNVILLTGSDFDGVALAADRFCAGLKPGKTLTIPRLSDIQLSKDLLKADPSLTADLSDADIEKQLNKVRDDFVRGIQGGVLTPVAQAASQYLRSGKEGYAKLFKGLMFLADDLSKVGQGNYGGEWGAAGDFLFSQLITSWDNVEESPSLTDADRRRITGIIFNYIHYWENHGYFGAFKTPGIRNNHITFAGQGFLAAAQYAKKYFNTPDSDKWLTMADQCFQPQLKSFQSQEDCGAYQWITARHIFRYATTRPDYSWFTSGNAKLAGDVAIMCTDNLGYYASFGDVGGFAPGSTNGALGYFIPASRDGRYVWLAQKNSRSLNYRPSIDIAPVEPVDLLGVKCMPTSPMFYDYAKGRGTAVPQDRTFDKITFRTSFNADTPYMLLDGINKCYHGHLDGNSILRFTDRGRIWLADCDYIKSQPKFHNSMLVFQDGQAAAPPALCERELVADLDHTGMSTTTTHDYAGADWRRHILWDKGHTFVVIDELQAQAAGDYSFRCQWQVLGDPNIKDNLFRSAQDGPSFSIRNLDGAKLRQSDDPVIGQNWKDYKYAKPVVHTLQQVRTQKMLASGSVFFLNVLTTEKSGRASLAAEKVSESSIILGAGRDRSLVGVRSNSDEIVPGVKTDAQMYWLSRRYAAFGGVTRIAIGNQAIFSSDVPVSVEFLPNGSVSISTDKPAHVSLPVTGATALVESKKRIPGTAVSSLFSIKMPEPVPAPNTASTTMAGGKEKLLLAGRFAPKQGKILSISASDNVICAGGSDGTVYALSADAKPVWQFNVGSEVRAVWTGRLQKDAPACIAVGTADAKIYLFDLAGKLLWKHDLPFFKTNAVVAYITSANLAGDGNHALIVGAENWRTYALDAGGNQIWEFEVLHASTAGIAVDLNDDGRDEVIAATEYYHWYEIKPDGQKLWEYRAPAPQANCVVAGKSGSESMAFFGAADGNVYAIDSLGKWKWSYSTGDEVTGIALADVDGDGNAEVISGSLSFDINAVKGDGKRLWRKDLGQPISALVLCDVNGDNQPEICAGTRDGGILVLGRDGGILAGWSAPGAVNRLIAVPGAANRLAVICGDGIVLLGMK